MENEKKIIHLNNKTKSQLADKLPEPARSMLNEEPEEMDLDTFIDHIGLYEKLVRKLKSKMKTRGDEEGVGPVSSVPILLVFLSALVILFWTEFEGDSDKWTIAVIGSALLALGYYFYWESDLPRFQIHQGDELRLFK
jgi:hypothetical protein